MNFSKPWPGQGHEQASTAPDEHLSAVLDADAWLFAICCFASAEVEDIALPFWGGQGRGYSRRVFVLKQTQRHQLVEHATGGVEAAGGVEVEVVRVGTACVDGCSAPAFLGDIEVLPQSLFYEVIENAVKVAPQRGIGNR